MLSEIIKRISSESGKPEKEINALIEEKRDELSGLISEEGAAYIVAKELGVAIIKQESLKISNIIPGMQNVDVLGKIIRITPVKEFKTEKASGRVANVTIGDETGTVRISLWNDEINALAGMELNDTIRVKGYVKEDNMGNAEVRLGRYGNIAKSDEEISSIKQTQRAAERSSIGSLSEGSYKEIRTPLLQIFEGNTFYEVCPECRGRVKLNEKDEFACEEHGEVEPAYGMIISGIADDGTGSIRIVFFNENAEKLLGMNIVEAKKVFDRKKKISAVLEQITLGKELLLTGRARRNQLFERLEFIVNDVKDVDVKKEIESLINDLDKEVE